MKVSQAFKDIAKPEDIDPKVMQNLILILIIIYLKEMEYIA